jgi:hypothetical protein
MASIMEEPKASSFMSENIKNTAITAAGYI